MSCGILKSMHSLAGRILIFFALVFVHVAFAEDEWGVRKTKDGIVKYKKRTEYEFRGLELEGKLKTPSGALVSPRKKAKLDSLIKLRTEFDNEVDTSIAGTR